MQCPACEKQVDDNSNHCPHCGAAIERGFCSLCGQPIGGPKNQSGGLILVFIMIMGLMFVLLSGQRQSIPQTAQAPSPKNPPEISNTYEILESNSIAFDNLMSYEYRISVNENAGKNIMVDNANGIINTHRSKNPQDIVVVYVYQAGVYETNKPGYSMKATYINTDLNPTYNIASLEGQEKVGDYVHVKWQES